MGDIGGLGARSVGKQTNRRRRLDQDRIMRMADPEKFAENYKRLLPTYRNFFDQPIWDMSEANRPDFLDADDNDGGFTIPGLREKRMQAGRQREATRKAGIRRPMSASRQAEIMSILGGQTELGGLGTDLVRRGMTGSPFAEAMRGGVAGGARARRSEALARFYQQAIAAAAEEAGGMQRAGLAAVGGVPFPQFAPSAGAAAGDAAMQALSLYLMGAGGGGNVAVAA